VGFLSRFFATGKDAFANDARKIASRAPGVAEVRYDRDDFALLVFRDGERRPVQVFLDNAYGECRGLPSAARR